MRLQILHRLRYDYDAPVRLGRQIVRLQPRSDGFQTLLDHELKVAPPAARRMAGLDPDGNSRMDVRFSGSVRSLEVVARSVVETRIENPFDWVVEPQHTRLPLAYPEDLAPRLVPWMGGAVGPRVEEVAKGAESEAGGRTGPFLFFLAKALHADLRQIVRARGAPREPELTLAAGEGACRDIALVFLAAARSRGYAARFVSGYHYKGPGEPHTLHAWAEAYLPGVGWRGYDPSLGLAIADRHVAVAAAARALDAAPLVGTYGPDKVAGRLEAAVEIVEVRGGDPVDRQGI